MKFIKVANFELGETPVTQAQWQKVMKQNPSYFKGEDRPVDFVSWDDCQEFIKKLNASQKEYIYRLPTEKEWGLAAKSCDEIPMIKQAWCYENSDSKTHQVGKLKPNKLGFYDMLGNVWEWCEDEWDESSSGRVFRGGSWYYGAQGLRSAYRGYYSPGVRYSFLGFRLLRTPLPSELLPSNPSEDRNASALAVALKALSEIEEILKGKKK